MEFTWLSRWQQQLLSILRIVVALLYLEHGTAKLLHFPIPQPGVPDPLPTILVAAAIIELVVGTLLVLGLFTRLAAFIASGEMAAGYFISHFPRGFWPVQSRMFLVLKNFPLWSPAVISTMPGITTEPLPTM